MTSKDAAYRPRAVDYSTNASWATPGESNGRLSSKRIRSNRTSTSASRVTGATRRSELPEPLSLPLGKISAALMFAAGGILVATSSTGTVSPAPELNTLTAALLPPDFFFADEDSAVDARALRHELNHSEPLIPPKKDSEDSSGLPRAHQVQAAMASILSDPKLNQEAQDQATTITSSTELPLPVTEVENTVQTPVATIAQEQEPVLTQKAPEAVQLVDETASTIAEVTVQTGDTLSGLLNDNGLKGNELAQLLEHKLVKDELSRLNVGQTFSIERDGNGKLLSLISRASPDRRITITRDGSGFEVAAADLPVEKERVVTSGTIQQSLYLAAEEADLKQSTIMELADIFQWELDFARDIRKGDHFSIVYDRLYREGEYIGDGDILAAEFVRGGRNYQAIRFTTDDGKSAYYTPDGESKRRTFLRHPVDVVRITSRFDPNRLHPVLHQIRAHKGVDYGAPHGSPIRATADGTIVKASSYGAYGQTVILKHGRKTSTLYAHMSRIADKSIVGKKVSQGDVIGYVGRTGRVTGTHLHYEYRINGTHVDPLTVELPAAEPIANEYRKALKIVSDEMIAQMQSVVPSQLASVAGTSSEAARN